MPPEVIVPEINSFARIHELALDRAAKKKRRTALVVPSQKDTLKAFLRATHDGLLQPMIIGDEKLLRDNAEKDCLDLADIEILNIQQPDMAIKTAALMAAKGELDAIVQGRITVEYLLSLLLQKEQRFRQPGRFVSHVGILQPKRYAKLLFLTDGAVMPAPGLKEKLGIIANLVTVAQAVGIPAPRLAAVCAVEVVYPQMPATVEAAALAKMSDRRQIKGAVVDGPLSFDVAVDMAAAHSKGITDSKVAGQADGFVAPSIEVAHGIYTAMTMFGECPVGGILAGGSVPVAVSSPADSEGDRYNSIVLATLA